jgi:hypothetical protein
MTIIDLKTHPFLCQLSDKTLEGDTYVHRTIDFLAGHGLHAVANFSPLCGQIPRRFQNKKVFLPRSIPLYGLRSAHLQRQSSRYRSVSSFSKQKALPYGHSWQCVQINSCRSQRKTRLAYICRIGSNSDCHSQKALQYRNLSGRIRGNCLRTRFNNHRSLPLSVSLGFFSKNEKCHQASYIAGFKREHSNIHPYFRWQAPRCKCTRYHALGGRSLLHYGSRLSGLQTTFFVQQNNDIFCNSSKIEHKIQKTLFTSRGQIHRVNLRPNNCLNGHKKQKTISRKTPAHQVQRSKDAENPCLSYKQFHFAAIDHCETVQKSLAGRIVFQMDQTTPQNQKVFRHIRECSKISDLDCSLSLCTRGNFEKEITTPRKPLHNFTDFKCDHIRKRFDLSANYRAGLHNRSASHL